jgi:hypothetical protein
MKAKSGRLKAESKTKEKAQGVKFKAYGEQKAKAYPPSLSLHFSFLTFHFCSLLTIHASLPGTTVAPPLHQGSRRKQGVIVFDRLFWLLFFRKKRNAIKAKGLKKDKRCRV